MDLGDITKRIIRNHPMSKVAALGVGGPADFYFQPRTKAEIQAGLQFAQKNDLPITLIGYGTNLLITDKGIRGLVIQLAENYATASVDGCYLTATAGCMFGSISKLAAYYNLTGLEFAVGIPGGVGGAIYMNAGAYNGEIGPLVRKVVWVTPEQIGSWNEQEYTYSYRHSRVQEDYVVVAETTLQLKPGNHQEILATMEDFQEQRRSKQPLEYPSAGSTFKRPAGHYVGPMIEQANLKGYQIGGAAVSTKHAGFVINTGNATATDFLNLIKHIQLKIKDQFDVDLEPEIRIIGER